MRAKMTTIPAPRVSRLTSALPFWLSLGMFPLALIAALNGGWTLALLPLSSWGLFSVLDALTGLNEDNAALDTPEAGLFWYRFVTILWFPLQIVLLCWLLWYVPRADHLNLFEKFALFFGMGVISGTIGIN